MVTKTDVRALIDVDADPAISIYMPVHAALPDREKNAIRLRNLMREAEDALRERGADPDKVLERARRQFHPEPPVRGRGTHGLAIFIAGDEVRTYPLPDRVPEMVAVGDGFRVASLLPFVEGEGYYVLTLDQESPALYHADRLTMEKLADGVMERSFDEIRGITQLPGRTGFHAGGPTGPARNPAGKPDATHHAQGESPEDYEQVQIDQYAHGIARAAEDRLKGKRAPLVAIGEPNMLGMFRKHCRYDGLTEEAVAKSPLRLEEEELHRLSLEVAADELARPAREAADRAIAAHNRGDATVEIKPRAILDAAEQGRVETLLLARNPGGPGLWIPEDESGGEDGQELRERLVRAVLAQGGDVMSVDREQLPDDASVTALYRF